jgi:hypothetical protein
LQHGSNRFRLRTLQSPQRTYAGGQVAQCAKEMKLDPHSYGDHFA